MGAQNPAAHGIASYIDSKGDPWWPGEGERWSRERLYYKENEGVCCSPISGPTTFEHFAVHCPILSAGAVLIRRSALETVGGWNPSFSTAADWDLWVRLSRLGGFAFCNEVVLKYRKQAGSMSSNRKKTRREFAEVRRLITHSPQNTPEQRAYSLRAYRGFYSRLARTRWRTAFESLRRGAVMTATKDLAGGLVNGWMALRGAP
jgi:GT2 family glycosyltransferase